MVSGGGGPRPIWEFSKKSSDLVPFTINVSISFVFFLAPILIGHKMALRQFLKLPINAQILGGGDFL